MPKAAPNKKEFLSFYIFLLDQGPIAPLGNVSYHLQQLKTFFDKIQGGSREWVWGVKSYIFGICQKVFLGIKMKMVFCQT